MMMMTFMNGPAAVVALDEATLIETLRQALD